MTTDDLADSLLVALWRDPGLDDDGKAYLYGLALAMYDGREDYPQGDLPASQQWVRDNGYEERARAELAACRD